MSEASVTVLIGTGAIGRAVARRVCAGNHVLLADLKQENAAAAADSFREDGIAATSATVDITAADSVAALAARAIELGPVGQVIVATGVSPSHASPELIFKVDLLGVALALDAFGAVIAPGGAGLVIGSQAGHRLPPLAPEQAKLIATTPVNELPALPVLRTDTDTDPLHAYQLAKHGASLRVKAEAVKWGRRSARLNAISPGIVLSPLAEAELHSENAAQYKRMIAECPSGRAGRPEEVAALAAFLMGEDGGFITGSDYLIDGGVTAAYFFGDLNSLR